jgi:hypothetical protein
VHVHTARAAPLVLFAGARTFFAAAAHARSGHVEDDRAASTRLTCTGCDTSPLLIGQHRAGFGGRPPPWVLRAAAILRAARVVSLRGIQFIPLNRGQRNATLEECYGV